MQISPLQLEQVNHQIQALRDAGSFYGKKLEEAGITGVSSVEDFENLPFSEKADLRDAYPLGLMTAPEEEIVRIHSSSGTTGLPVIIPYTRKDVDDWATMFARCYEMAGITNKDRIHITPGYGLWTAGIGFQAGAEKLGAMCIPMGPGNTDKQLQMMVDMKSTVLCATSSYALLLAEEIEKRGIKDKIHLKKGVIGSERWGDAMRKRISEELGIELYDIYGLTEIYGPGIGISCQYDTGMHYWDEARPSSGTAPTTCPASSPVSAPAAASTRASTSSRAARTTWSRSRASTSSRPRSKSASPTRKAPPPSTRSASLTSTAETPCVSTSKRRPAWSTSRPSVRNSPTRSRRKSASPPSSRSSSSACCPAPRRSPSASSTNVTTDPAPHDQTNKTLEPTVRGPFHFRMQVRMKK